MPTLIDTMNTGWALLSGIQPHAEATQAIKDLAERVKQESIVEMKRIVGLQL